VLLIILAGDLNAINMKGSFGVFTIGLIVSFILITTWNLNHVFHWMESGDKLYGTGFAIILLASAYHIHAVTPNGLRHVITVFFLFCSLSNLMDELFFDPYVVNFYEYLTAFILTPLIYHRERIINRIKKARN
jgi:hypothetical protein